MRVKEGLKFGRVGRMRMMEGGTSLRKTIKFPSPPRKGKLRLGTRTKETGISSKVLGAAPLEQANSPLEA